MAASGSTSQLEEIINLDHEYEFYSHLIRQLAATAINDSNKVMVVSWINKLHSPQYNVSIFRDKRNRYLLSLCIDLLMCTITHPFDQLPPAEVLPDIEQMAQPTTRSAAWETDQFWTEMLQSKAIMAECAAEQTTYEMCAVHTDAKCPDTTEAERPVGVMLDKQFSLFLFIARPYAAMLPHGDGRSLAAKWLQRLGGIAGDVCIAAKGIRNDYMMALLGYLSNGQLSRPFQNLPPLTLQPMREVIVDKRPITDPTHPRADQFLAEMPVTKEGVFAYISLTGDLYNAKF